MLCGCYINTEGFAFNLCHIVFFLSSLFSFIPQYFRFSALSFFVSVCLCVFLSVFVYVCKAQGKLTSHRSRVEEEFVLDRALLVKFFIFQMLMCTVSGGMCFGVFEKLNQEVNQPINQLFNLLIV